jgi:hypothetical protein
MFDGCLLAVTVTAPSSKSVFRILTLIVMSPVIEGITLFVLLYPKHEKTRTHESFFDTLSENLPFSSVKAPVVDRSTWTEASSKGIPSVSVTRPEIRACWEKPEKEINVRKKTNMNRVLIREKLIIH